MTEQASPKNVWQKGRKGPDSRKRPVQLNIRLAEDEARQLEVLAGAQGVSLASLIRNALLGIPLPRRRPKPRVEEAALARLLAELAAIRAELGKSGSNLNQIAFQLNADRDRASLPEQMAAALEEHEEALRLLLELRAGCMQALGLEGGRKDQD